MSQPASRYDESDSPQSAPPLTGVRIIDASQALAGPSASMLLGDLGAEIIKVEPPAGDITRVSPPHFIAGESLYFLANNRNKRSVVIDLKTVDGRAVLRDLARIADVVFYNYSPGVARRLGLDHETMAQVNPRIITCSITGLGETGPLARRPLVDVVAQAAAGAMSITGEADRPPVRAGIATADLSTGLYAAVGILAALHRRELTGRGSRVETSLFHSQLSLLNYHAAFARYSGVAPKRIGSAHIGHAVYGVFRTADGWVTIDAGFDHHFRGLCRAMGMPELAEDPKFALDRSRNQHRQELLPILDAELRKAYTREWCARLDAEGVPAGPVNDVLEALEHPQAAEYESVRRLAFDDTEVDVLASPLWFDGGNTHRMGSPPRLGEHTIEVLQDLLGYGRDQIDRLVASGAVHARPGSDDDAPPARPPARGAPAG